MGLVKISEAREVARKELSRRTRTAKTILEDASATSAGVFDVFLSHSILDAELVLGAKLILEAKGLRVYVDWVDDPFLERSNVNKETAQLLRKRMRQCENMFYLHTKNSTLSKWCPWELGYFDAQTYPKQRVFLFPLVDDSSFSAQEYLGLYPIIDIDGVGVDRSEKQDIWIYDGQYSRFRIYG